MIRFIIARGGEKRQNIEYTAPSTVIYGMIIDSIR
jgi:hypothetical protein